MNAREWFNNLQARERALLIGGSIVLLLLILYLWLLEPLSKDLTSLRGRVEGGEAQLAWMNSASTEAQNLKSTGTRGRSVDTRTSLITAVERSSSQAGIRTQVKRMEPQGNDKLSVEMEAVPFDQLMTWLGNLESDFAARVIQINSNRSNLPGRVDARIILGRDAA